MNNVAARQTSGYTLQVVTVAKPLFRPAQHVARLVNARGRVCNEWVLSIPCWLLKQHVEELRSHIEEMLGNRATLPVCYTELPPSRNNGTRQRAFSFATAMPYS